MATRPELHIAVAKTKSKASEYNDNFDMMMDFVDDSIQESKDYVDGFMPDVTGNAGKFLKTNGTTTSWFNLLGANNTFTGNNTFSGATTFSGNVTISGGTFDFPKCTTKPTTTSTASNTLPAVIIQNYRNGKSWYRVWSDKWCEQGGWFDPSAGSNSVSLLKTMADTNYSAQLTLERSPATATHYTPLVVSKTTSKLTIGINQNPEGCYWQVCGWIS